MPATLNTDKTPSSKRLQIPTVGQTIVTIATRYAITTRDNSHLDARDISIRQPLLMFGRSIYGTYVVYGTRFALKTGLCIQMLALVKKLIP